jgi:hypothetical protein
MIDQLTEEICRDFLGYYKKNLKIKKLPTFSFVRDQENAENPLCRTGAYDPVNKHIVIFVTGRHAKDILRSLGHELYHHHQNENGLMDQDHSTPEGYAQNNKHLRGLELKAYSDGGGIMFRDWEDGYKARLK